MPKVSVLVPAFHHRLNLLRCLEAWRRQTVPFDQLIVIDDGGNADVPPRPGEQLVSSRETATAAWRTINMAVRRAWPLVEHDYIILCSCDLLFTSHAIEKMLETQVDDCRCSSTVYGLNRELSKRIDFLDWKGTEGKVFEEADSFLAMPNNFGGINADSSAWSAHILFNGNTRAGWERFDPLVFPPAEGIGADECWLRQVEVDAGRPIIMVPYPVYHQWHPFILPGFIYNPAGELPGEWSPDVHSEGHENVSARIRRITAPGSG